MPTSLYTPFLADIGATLGRGLEKRGLRQQQDEKNKLIQSAYMDQPGALQQLQTVDPQAAAKVEAQKRQKKQDVLQTRKLEASEEDRTKKIFLENKELVDKTLREAVKLDSMEDGQAYVDRVLQQNQEIFKDAKITPFTPESWAQVKKVYAKEDTLSAEALEQKKAIARAGTPGGGEQVVTPPELIKNLSPDVGSQASAAYMAAGGGKDGIKALIAVTDQASQQEQKLTSPTIIANSFPEASRAEAKQLQSSMDAAKNTSEGLKEAIKVREEQRRLKKAQVFQNRGIYLLTKILENPELDDVIGATEGDEDSFYNIIPKSDAEAEAVSDIAEAKDILTADNLKLMTGVLSETDIKILANLAGGALNRKRGEVRFREDAQGLLDKLSANLVLTVDDVEAARVPTTPPSGKEDGVLHTDANGNNAFVFPDGTFEEI